MPAKTAVKYVVKRSVEFYANAIWMLVFEFAALDSSLKKPAIGGLSCQRNFLVGLARIVPGYSRLHSCFTTSYAPTENRRTHMPNGGLRPGSVV